MEKKALWRIMEAVVAVLILSGGILFFLTKNNENGEKTDYSKLLITTLDEMSKDLNLRNQILSDDDSSNTAEDVITNLLDQRIINPRLNYKVIICNFGNTCGNLDSDLGSSVKGDIYSEERVISATLDNFNPKIVKIYLWNV